MRIVLAISNDIKQISLIPDNKEEANVCDMMAEHKDDIKIERGSFQECQAGFLRKYEEDGIIIILKSKK